jgi:hypothetical protein
MLATIGRLLSGVDRRATTLALCYAAAGALVVLAVRHLVAIPGPRFALVYLAAAVLLALLARRFVGDGMPRGPLMYTLPLLASWAAGGGLALYGVVQTVPTPRARLSTGLIGAGLLMAVLGWRFLSDAATSAATPVVKGSAKESEQERDTRWTRDTVLTFCYVGAVGVMLFAIRAVVPVGGTEVLLRVLGAGVLIACGALLSGALLGFLFGIPRAPTPPEPLFVRAAAQQAGTTVPAAPQGDRPPSRPALQVNTNLEQISDWLTKIIVGLGLIHLSQIDDGLRYLAAYFATAFGPIEGREAFTLSLLVSFSVSGFLLGYLLTRLFLTMAFTRVERGLTQFEAAAEVNRLVQDAGNVMTPVPSPGAGGAATPLPPVTGAPTPAAGAAAAAAPATAAAPGSHPGVLEPQQIAAALRVEELASQLDPEDVRRQMLTLAKEYDLTRTAMVYSERRTVTLDAIVARMRVLCGAAQWMLPQLTRGGTSGERLAAIAILQSRPDARYLTWLVERQGREQPFLQYHAALAMRHAVDQLAGLPRPLLVSTIEAALQATTDAGARKFLNDAKAQLAGPA